MEKRKLTSLWAVLLRYLVQTALCCVLAAVLWFVILLLLIHTGIALPTGPRACPMRRPRAFCQR